MRLRNLSVLLAAGIVSADGRPRLDYGRDVRPILAENCFHCHGQDGNKRMASLRLDSREGATADHQGRVALAPGKPASSGIYQRIAIEQGARKMPPAYSNRTLTAGQVGVLKRWIEEGGEYSKHWAFEPPKRPAVPKVSDVGWAKNPIDAFVLERLQQTEGLRPNAAATPAAWLRRVSLDLTGLPPSPSEADAFTKDAQQRSDAAYRTAVSRLLASPAYGERLAMDWLDVARYADTHGFNNDSSRSMWRWRDWVIQSFNSNQRYDRFLTEQLAGDLLPNPTLDQRIATGFGRNHVINSEGGIIDEEYRVEYVSDRVRTLGMSWLGLTLECARCHDHKYDPITQRDHYRFFAFFNNLPERGEDGRVTNAAPLIAAPTNEQQAKMRSLEARIAALTASAAKVPWVGRDSQVEAEAGTPPGGAVWQMHCEAASDFAAAPESGFVQAEGIAGKACVTAEMAPKPLSAGKGVPVSKRQPLTIAVWLRPAETDTDVPLLSDVDYATNPAATTHGRGMEVRLLGGEVEFRFGDRLPAYLIRVRSEGAAFKPGQWRHLTVVYEGAAGKDTMRAEAAWVRMFVDGHEVGTLILNEGVALPEAKGDKAKPTVFRVGWDTQPNSARYAGRLDELAAWNRALNEAEISSWFESQALPFAVKRQRGQQASAVEIGWLRTAALRRTNAVFAEEQRELAARRAELLTLRRHAPTVMVMQELTSPRQTHILLRGGYNAPGEKVDPGVPEDLLGAWPAGAPRNRLGLAQWLTKPDHPLTARVVVNRFWQQLFGTGLVKTSDNFGLQGESPSHPELLDWLARDFIDSGWDVKRLLAQIVLSATYRQDSAASQEVFARDPENRLLARGPRFRLPGEAIRDQALLISGLLKPRVGGPSVFPYQTPGLYKGIVVAADYPGTQYIDSRGDDLYRRSLYTFWKRTVPHPTMNVFDAPDREFCTVRRSTTNTPMQALTLLNDPIYVEAARKLAERSIHEGGATVEGRLAYTFRLATGRVPSGTEKQILQKTFDQMLAIYRANEREARSFLSVGSSAFDGLIPVGELAAYTAVANMVLNMDEVVTKG